MQLVAPQPYPTLSFIPRFVLLTTNINNFCTFCSRVQVLFENLESAPAITTNHAVFDLVHAVVMLLDRPFYDRVCKEREEKKAKSTNVRLIV